MSLTCLPRCVSQCLRVLGPCFRHGRQLVFSWLLVLHLVYGERANLKALAGHGPRHLAYQYHRRLLCAAYWWSKTLLWWFADQTLQAFPPPDNGILYVVGDRTLKGKRGSKHPVAQKTRLSQHHPYVFGFRIVLLMAQWGVYRIPVDFTLVRRKDDPGYQPEKRPVSANAPRFSAPSLVSRGRGGRRCGVCLARQHDAHRRTGLLVCVCPPSDLEVHQWEDAQGAGNTLSP